MGHKSRERKRKGLLLRQPYKVQIQVNTPSYCTMIGLLHKLVRIQGDQGTYHKRALLKYSFYTWAKTQNAATRPTVHRKPIFYPLFILFFKQAIRSVAG